MHKCPHGRNALVEGDPEPRPGPEGTDLPGLGAASKDEWITCQDRCDLRRHAPCRKSDGYKGMLPLLLVTEYLSESNWAAFFVARCGVNEP